MSYRVIQVGLGDFGRRWMRVVLDHPSWEYAAIATRNDDVRSLCGDECGLPPESRFSSLDEALNSGIDADAVLITTPHFRHRDDAVTALKSGAHVLLEKPLAGDLESCIAIRDAARNAEGQLMIGENYRFGDGSRRMREIVASGRIGIPEFAMIQYFVGHTFPEGDWRNEYEYPLLIENATHQFDLMRYITGSNPVNVYCRAFGSRRTPHWPKPNVTAQFQMDTGLAFSFNASWSYTEFRTPWEGMWRLHGSAGSVMWVENRIVVESGGERETFDLASQPSDHTLKATFEEFHDAITGRRISEVDISDNMHTIGMVFGAIASSERGESVHIPDLI